MNPYLVLILVLLVGTTLFDALVNWLNLRVLRPEIPEEFQGVYDADKYRKSQDYLRATTRFHILSDLIQTGLLLTFLLLGGFAWMHAVAVGTASGMVGQGLVFGGILLLLTTLVSIPFSVYDTFVVEERFGFNRTKPGTFVADLVKGLLLSALLGGLLFAAIIQFFHSAGSAAWLISWAAVLLFQLVILYIAPVVILPLFNKFEPLKDGELKSRLETYAQGQGFHLQGLFRIDGSKRSTKSNAYFTGFGRNRRIALYDTLIENHSVDELVAVLAHEVGHAKRKHIHKSLLVSVFTTGLMFYLLSLFIERPGMYQAFGINTEVGPLPLYAGLIFFGFLYSPVSKLLGVLHNALSRRHEFEADAFAAQTTDGGSAMIQALKKLSVDNLSNLTPHPLLVTLEYSHPPVLQRIQALRRPT